MSRQHTTASTDKGAAGGPSSPRAPSSTKTIFDSRQLDIFTFEDQAESLLDLSIPAHPDRQAGALDCDQQIRRALNVALAKIHRQQGKNRIEVAAELSALTGRRISKAMLDSYTGAGRPNRLPADLLPALCVILGPELLSRLADKAGCKLATREETILANAGKVIYLEDVLAQKKQQLLEQLPGREVAL